MEKSFVNVILRCVLNHCIDFTYDTKLMVTYRAWEEDAILELTEEVGNEEAAQHQAHREQGSVGA